MSTSIFLTLTSFEPLLTPAGFVLSSDDVMLASVGDVSAVCLLQLLSVTRLDGVIVALLWSLLILVIVCTVHLPGLTTSVEASRQDFSVIMPVSIVLTGWLSIVIVETL
jgi:hypothetical protein